MSRVAYIAVPFSRILLDGLYTVITRLGTSRSLVGYGSDAALKGLALTVVNGKLRMSAGRATARPATTACASSWPRRNSTASSSMKPARSKSRTRVAQISMRSLPGAASFRLSA